MKTQRRGGPFTVITTRIPRPRPVFRSQTALNGVIEIPTNVRGLGALDLSFNPLKAVAQAGAAVSNVTKNIVQAPFKAMIAAPKAVVKTGIDIAQGKNVLKSVTNNAWEAAKNTVFAPINTAVNTQKEVFKVGQALFKKDTPPSTSSAGSSLIGKTIQQAQQAVDQAQQGPKNIIGTMIQQARDTAAQLQQKPPPQPPPPSVPSTQGGGGSPLMPGFKMPTIPTFQVTPPTVVKPAVMPKDPSAPVIRDPVDPRAGTRSEGSPFFPKPTTPARNGGFVPNVVAKNNSGPIVESAAPQLPQAPPFVPEVAPPPEQAAPQPSEPMMTTMPVPNTTSVVLTSPGSGGKKWILPAAVGGGGLLALALVMMRRRKRKTEG